MIAKIINGEEQFYAIVFPKHINLEELTRIPEAILEYLKNLDTDYVDKETYLAMLYLFDGVLDTQQLHNIYKISFKNELNVTNQIGKCKIIY